MDRLLETVALQSEVTKIQAEVIDELFLLLMQHISAEEADKLPVIEKINQAAAIHRELGTDFN